MDKAIMAVSAAILVSLAMPAQAGAVLQIEEGGEPQYVRKPATIIHVDEVSNKIKVRGDDNSIILLNISGETFVVDGVSGLNASLSERVNNTVHVYHSPTMSHNDPPETDALVVMLNIPQEYTPPRFHIVGAAATNNGDMKLRVDNGGLVVHLSADTGVTAPLTTSKGQEAELSQVREDSRLLLWYEAVAMSYPAQTTATRAVLLTRTGDQDRYSDNTRNNNEAEGSADNEYEAYPAAESDGYDTYTERNGYNGNNEYTAQPHTAAQYELPEAYSEPINGDTWVPLRRVAEGLGYTVTWDDQERSARVQLPNGETATAVIGDNGRLIDNRTFVCTGFFESASVYVTHNNGIITFACKS
ncbi:MAG: copper amine oxidase N-terminal domain-containing protein [Defluviitaleaceae bacterium]|nr:copper amine oxidase N-terminal domain-containing protein [Defluviitaleaceae bacterium]